MKSTYRIHVGHIGPSAEYTPFHITVGDMAGISPPLLLGTDNGDTIGHLRRFISADRNIDLDRVKLIDNEIQQILNTDHQRITKNMDIMLVIADAYDPKNWDTVEWANINDGEEAAEYLFDNFLGDEHKQNTSVKMLSIIRNNLTKNALKTIRMYLTEGDNGLPMSIYHNQHLRRNMLDAIRDNPNR